MYIDMKIGDQGVISITDTSAAHTFVTSKIVKECGLIVTYCAKNTKAVNSTA